jgi:hypothetical protein
MSSSAEHVDEPEPRGQALLAFVAICAIDLASCFRSSLWYGDQTQSATRVGCAKFHSHSHREVIRVCDDAGNVIGEARAIGRRSAFSDVRNISLRIDCLCGQD